MCGRRLVSNNCMLLFGTQRHQWFSKHVSGICRKPPHNDRPVSLWYSDKLISSLPPPHGCLLLQPLFRNNKGASCVCEFLPWRDSRRSTELWARRRRMKEIFLKFPAEQLSSLRPVNRIWFIFNFTIFLFLAPDSWTMTRALCRLLQLQDKNCVYIG